MQLGMTASLSFSGLGRTNWRWKNYTD